MRAAQFRALARAAASYTLRAIQNKSRSPGLVAAFLLRRVCREAQLNHLLSADEVEAVVAESVE
jgi:hypothetical protein